MNKCVFHMAVKNCGCSYRVGIVLDQDSLDNPETIPDKDFCKFRKGETCTVNTH